LECLVFGNLVDQFVVADDLQKTGFSTSLANQVPLVVVDSAVVVDVVLIVINVSVKFWDVFDDPFVEAFLSASWADNVSISISNSSILVEEEGE
jgi:hypothetical protein